MTLNRVMMNQFDNCACFHMNPEKPDKGALTIETKQKEVVWLKFEDSYDVSSLSAETIASMFSEFGDFHVFKDTKQSVLMHFYYLDKNYIECKSTEGFIAYMSKPESKAKYHVSNVSTLFNAPKFVAHNHLE